MHCDVRAGVAEDGAPIAHMVNTFFDFAQSSDVVNSALNSQGLAIPVSQYKYVRLEFCKLNQQETPNVAWQGGYNNTETEFNRGGCTVNSIVMNPPLNLAKGESATVHLA